MTVSYSTPLEVIEQLKSRINDYVAANSREWSGCAVNIDKMEYQNAIHLVVAMERMCIFLWVAMQFTFWQDRPNWQDWGGRWARRTAFMRNLKTILEELDVKFTMPVQPVLLPRSSPPAHLGVQPPVLGSPRTPRTPRAQEVFGNAGTFH